MLEKDKKKSDITPTNIGKIQIIIAAPKTGLNKKLNWNTFTCGAVLEIIPRIISWPNDANKIGEAICRPTYKTFAVIEIKYSGDAIDEREKDVIKIPQISKVFFKAIINQYKPPILI